ncbi:hypothetical protein EV183_003693 [Coemansia sp. RSA 2336]|nr:hypothetical protein EV183_003693 [Coemansia sp. RSA 2336]
MERKTITQTLDLERSFVEPVVKAILHTIIFHRYFGNVVPRDTTILSSITYASVENTEVINTVDAKVHELVQSLSPVVDSKSQISLYFTETKPRRAWFSRSEEEICWEEWIIYVNYMLQLQEKAQDQTRQALLRVIQEMDQHKEHIPLIATNEANPFPYHISVAPASGIWSSMLKRAIRPGLS